LKFLESLERGLTRFEGWMVILFLGTMVVFTFVQVCLRGLYTHAGMAWASQLLGAVEWSEPLVRLLVLWLALFGASLVSAENRHIRIDFLSALVPPRWEPFRDFLLSLACAGITGAMAVVATSYLRLEMKLGGALFLQVPQWVGLLVLPLGFGAICFRFTLRSVRAMVLMRSGEGR
jgi:TRAP-type C4-dicarboxylate transport system permease small subunit